MPAGYTLFQLGDRVVACYLLVEGMLAETRGDDAWLVDAPGAMVGAAESFVGAVASSTVTAVMPTLVLALPTRALLGGVERSRPLRTATFVELARRALPPARRHAAGRHLDPADT